jgi:hypothetical protein
MNPAAQRTDLLPAAVPDYAVVLLAAFGVALWLAARHLTRRHGARLPWQAVVGLRALLATAAAWGGLQGLGRWTELGSRCPVWTAALLLGLGVEGMAALYRRERKAISTRLGVALTLLRGAAILVLALMLLRPVLVWNVNRAIVRRVAVLFDDSSSMRFVDRQWTVSERMELALHAGLLQPAERPLPALDGLAALPARMRPWAAGTLDTNEAPAGLARVLTDGAAQARELQAQADGVAGRLKGDEDRGVRDALARLQRHVRDTLAPAFVEAVTASAGRRLAPSHVLKAGDAADLGVEIGASARAAADELCWARLDAARRQAIDAFCATTRVALAVDILARRPPGGEALLDRIADRYDLDLFRLGHGVERLRADRAALLPSATGAPGSNAVARHDWSAAIASNDAPLSAQQAFRALTDYPAALESILRDIPSEQLAGVLIVSDGRNNGESGLDPVGRRLGMQGVPVCGVVVGGSRPPLDVAIADVAAPESIYLGDKVRARVTLRITGCRGKRLTVRMNDATGTVDQAVVDVSSDDVTREIRLTHEPKEQGVRRYALQADLQEGELFTENNAWTLDVAVSDDRTNVLLADDRPRWEFRYLRNLFFGRDKSVHLQYLLLHPDQVAGVRTEQPLPPASAARKFGDAEAGSLPVGRDEWRKFDVIILGDLGPETLTPPVVAELRHCVGERGALLVVVAGPRAMPHALRDETLAELLPERWAAPPPGGLWLPPEEKFRLALTAPGRQHPVMQQSASLSANEAVWNEIPELSWRFPVLEVKPGAEVLAYAQTAEPGRDDLAGLQVADAAARLEDEARLRSRNALVVCQAYGRGKVLMLNFDQTWRLRYRAGDKYHHRFWGQVMRWGVGEKLRAGREGLRLGTDALVYTPSQGGRVLARVTDERFAAVADAQLEAAVTHDGKEVARVRPAYREGSHGLYEAALPAFADPGRYDVALARRDRGKDERVETSFLVVTAARPVELADVTATRAACDVLARWTGGRVVGPARAHELWDAFGEGRRSVQERREQPLWDRPWLFLVVVGLLTAEWLLRKRGGLT